MPRLTFEFHAGEGIDPAAVDAEGLLVGKRHVPVPGRLRVEAGRVEAESFEPGSFSLAVPVDLGSVGVLRMQTTLLLPQDRPYRLLYELARERIKQFLWKAEEWQMWDRPEATAAIGRFEEARELAGAAIVARDARDADRHARESLAAAVDAIETLAAAHASILLRRKYGSKGAPRTLVGMRVTTGVAVKLLAEESLEAFQLVSIPTAWAEVEPAEGRFEWSRLDRWMVAAANARRPILAGPLLDLAPSSLPGWALSRRRDAKTFRSAAYSFCEAVIRRYQGAVGMWNIASGMPERTEEEGDHEFVVSMTRMASVLVRQLHPASKILVEITDPFSDRLWLRPDGLDAGRYLRLLTEGGVRFDAVGLRFAEGVSRPLPVDLGRVASLADRFVSTEWSVVATGIGAPSSSADGRGWRGPWSPASQAAWLEAMLAILLARPRCDAAVIASLVDAEGDAAGLGIVDRSGRAKPAVKRLGEWVRRLRRPPVAGAAGPDRATRDGETAS